MMKNLSLNIAFHYLYRDAGNYKLYETAVFSNPEGLSLETIDQTIRTNLIDGEFFDPDKWGLEMPAFPEGDDELDHGWCEYLGVEVTEAAASLETTILAFLTGIEKKEMAG